MTRARRSAEGESSGAGAYLCGIDIGGTFTDCVVVEKERQQ